MNDGMSSDRRRPSQPRAVLETPSGSRVIHFDGFRWQGVRALRYKDDEEGERWRDVTRQQLVGPKEATPFHLRYFEVEPGGFTTLERHGHEHVVVVIRGEGRVRLGDEWDNLKFGDAVYVAPNEPHQFRASGSEPFGFICVVSAKRDRPEPLV